MPETDDPNADLVGFTYIVPGPPRTDPLTYTVTGITTWSPQYLNVEASDGFQSVVPVSLIRDLKARTT